ncbi:MAG: hypothetical protein SFX72_20820 [Isosphaeraceae bacterium]|nr:hypothetical protein [Isosphaeraceae bacterium]
MSGPRRFINDLVYFARQVPSVPVSRTMNVSDLFDPRRLHPAKPAWAALFMKAFALIAAEHPPLRRAYLGWPWGRLYEHPQSICALAVERKFDNEDGVFVGLFRAPEAQAIGQLQRAVDSYKNQPLHDVGYYRQALRVSRLPWPLRKFLWWSTLNVSGLKRAKRFGTYGLTTYGALGAESLHPMSPLTSTLTFGPISDRGDVSVKLIYDHRVLDGAYVARRLLDLESALLGPVREELLRREVYVEGPESVLKPHLLGYPVPRKGAERP